MRRRLALAAMLPVAGCAHGGMRAGCDAASAQALLGAAATEANRTKAERLAGARENRMVQRGTIITTEYRPGRLTIDADDAGNITRIACG